MAKIEPMQGKSTGASSGQQQSSYNKIMPPGQYMGKIIDIGYSSDKEQTRKILYVAIARIDLEELSPRVIRARFDIWNTDNKIHRYALEALYYFVQAMECVGSDDTDNPNLLQNLIEGCLFKDVYFTVDKLISQNGFGFNVVKNFKAAKLNAEPLSTPVEQSQSQREQQHNPANFTPAPTYQAAIPPAGDNWIEDDVPF